MVSLLDANVILRLLLEENGHAYLKSRSVFDRIESSELQATIPAVVVAECLYVMTGFYGKSREISAHLLTKLFHLTGIVNDDLSEICEALRIYGTSKLDFVDSYLIALRKYRDYEIISYDRDIEKYLKKHP